MAVEDKACNRGESRDSGRERNAGSERSFERFKERRSRSQHESEGFANARAAAGRMDFLNGLLTIVRDFSHEPSGVPVNHVFFNVCQRTGIDSHFCSMTIPPSIF